MIDKKDGLFSLENKVILITGGGRGMGYAIAIAMAERNAFVYCIDIAFNLPIPESLKKRLFYEKCDITKAEKFKKICNRIFIKFKRIDILINGAGVSYPNKDKYDKSSWDKTVKINLTAAFTCSQICCEYMAKNRTGAIVNITSLNAERAFPNNPAYVASKGGLKMLGKAMAKDWGIYGIRVNNLAPGYIRTSMTEKSYKNKIKRKMRESNTMLGRWGRPADLVGPCVFLSSDASSYITGADIHVDGGWLANGLPMERK